MTIRKALVQYSSAVLVFVTATTDTYAAPIPTHPAVPSVGQPVQPTTTEGSRLSWSGGPTVEVCDNKAKSCIRRPMPKGIGPTKEVIRAPFLDKRVAQSSWLALSTERASLCYLTTKAPVLVSCRPIPAKITPDIRITAFEFDGHTFLRIKPAPSSAGQPQRSRKQIEGSIAAFASALERANLAASKNASMRYSGQLIPTPTVIDAGGGCYDDEGGGYCDGDGGGGGSGTGSDGGGNDGGGESGGDDAGGDGDGGDTGAAGDGRDDTGGAGAGGDGHDDGASGDGGGDTGGGGGGEMPDTGGNEDDGGDDSGDNNQPPGLPFPPGTTRNEDGGTTTCYPTPLGAICIVTAPRPGEEPGEPPLPPGPPADDRPWYCDIPVIGNWLCGGGGSPADPPAPPPPSAPPPSEPTTENDVPPPYDPPRPRPDDGRPFAKYREGYEQAVADCDAQLEKDHQDCSLDYIYLGGAFLRDKERLTEAEKRQLKKANNEYSACKNRAANDWDICLRDARDKFREPTATTPQPDEKK